MLATQEKVCLAKGTTCRHLVHPLYTGCVDRDRLAIPSLQDTVRAAVVSQTDYFDHALLNKKQLANTNQFMATKNQRKCFLPHQPSHPHQKLALAR